jgi:DNA modification methylase
MLKEQINDWGQARASDGKVFFAGSWRNVGSSDFYTGKGFGAFNPAIASWILNMYAPKDGFCFDPFAGGGTRAIMAAKHGLNYIGCEIRKEEVEAVNKRCEACGVGGSVQILNVDSRRSQIPDGIADFSFTCPPYFNLEQYDGGPDDLSMAPTYMHFCAGMTTVLGETLRILKPGALSVWVVGLLRKESGELIPLNHDIARLATARGFYLKEEIILAHRNNGAIQRVGNFEKGNKFLIRTHEYALVFEKK